MADNSETQPANIGSTEIDLVEKAYWRIALADSEEKLERVLDRLLAPVLLKAASENDEVRTRVRDIVGHIIERLTNLDKILLPVNALLTQCQDPLTKQATIVYNIQLLSMGYKRLPVKEQAALLSDVLKCIPGKTPSQQAALLRLFILGVSELHFPKNVEERKSVLSLSESPLVKNILLEFLLDFLLLPYGKITLPEPPSPVEQSSSIVSEGTRILPPPGLSLAAVERTTGGVSMEPIYLEKKKRDILTFLTSEIFSLEDIMLHLVLASGDTRQSVNDLAEDKLKVFGSSFDWNNKAIINRLFSLFQGSLPQPQGRPQSSAPVGRVELQRSPISLRVKIKVLPYLLKSQLAASMFPQSLQLAFECLFGKDTHARLQHLGTQFIQHMCDNGKSIILAKIAPVLLNNGLNRLIADDQQDQKLRELAFVGIGKLARRVPQYFGKNVNYVVNMFKALKEETQDVGLAVQECLSSLSHAYVNPEGLTADTLEALVLENVENEHAGTRLAALHLATTVFPFSHVPSRYVCMLACGDEREDIVEEGRKSLRLSHDLLPQESDGKVVYPKFPELVKYIKDRGSNRQQYGKAYATSSGSIPFKPKVFSIALEFCQTCLREMCSVTVDAITAMSYLPKMKEFLDNFCLSEKGMDTLTLYVNLIKQALSPSGGGDLHGVALGCLVEVAVVCSSHSTRSLLPSVQWVKGFLGSPRVETREQAAQLLGMLSSSLGEVEYSSLLNELMEEMDSSKMLEQQHGTVLAVGYVCASQVSSVCEPMEVEEDCTEEEQKSKKLKRENAFVDVLNKLVKLISPSQQKLLSLAGCCALRQVVRVSPLPFPNGSPGEGDKGVSPKDSCRTKQDFVRILIKCLSNVKDVRCKEQCALTLGMLPVGDEKFPFVQQILEGLFDTVHLKHLDLHMTIGEAVSCAAAGRYSKAARDPWKIESDTPTSEPLPPHTVDNLQWTLQALISKDYCVSSTLGHRQASGLWMVALLKFCGDIPIIKEHLKDFQMVFVNMLTDDDVAQETASRGLGLIYDLTDKEHRKDLVVLLSNTLLMGRKSNVTVTAETKLFPEGVLGKAPQGGKLTTYQELCSVASDMNKPDLIYKFLSLANHHSIWNSKKGAAFGFQHIAQQAKEELQPHLPVLVPKLYRYQYDPHSGIKQAMKSIWSSIVPDTRKAVDQYLKEIMEDLQQNLNHHLWRNRESSCLALGDLLTVSQLEDVVPYLPDLWEMCLKVLDDIKESVRDAAEIACRLLSRVTIRACDPTGPGASKAMEVLGKIFPVLLEQGMSSTVQETRAISLVTLLKITKDAGSLLKPHISLLVPVLLDSVSSLEPQVLNTVSLKLGDDEKVQEKLDNIRISASKSSPMIEAVNFCLPYVDSTTMEQLVPKLIDIIKTGVGMATKVNTAQFVVSLARQSPHDIAPFVGKLLGALLSGLNDRSAGTRKAYATAIGQLIKYAKTSSVERLNEKLKVKFLEKSDESILSTVGSVYYSMVMYSCDSLKSVMDQVVPLVFLAMHERPKGDSGESPYAEPQQLWQNVWDELVTSTESAVRMYSAEIALFVCQTLEETNSWHLKAQSAAAIATFASKAGPHLGPPQLNTICKVLLRSLSGRVWEGKESLLKAVKTVTISSKGQFLGDEVEDRPSVVEFIDVILKECKRKNPSYQVVALDALGCILEEYDVDYFKDVFEMTQNMISRPTSDDNEEEEDSRSVGGREPAVRIEILVKCYMLLGRAWPRTAATQARLFVPVFELIKKNITSSTWKVQLAMFTALSAVFRRFNANLTDGEWKQTSSDMATMVTASVTNVKYSTLRMKSLESLDSFTLLLKDKCSNACSDLISPALKDSLESLKNPKEKELADSILSRLQTP